MARGGDTGNERASPAVLHGDVGLMTDFLRRIAQRALGVSPVVQPVMGSRYAPTPDLSVPSISPPEDRPSRNPAEQTSDRESLLADASSSWSARQIIRPAPPVDAVEKTAGPFAAPAAPAAAHLNIQSLSESEEDAFASPAENTRTRARPRGEGLEQSSTLIVGEPSAAHTELQQPTTQINDVRASAPHANTDVNSGTIIPREDVSRSPGEVMLQRQEIESAPVLSLPSPESSIDAKPASHHGRNSLDSPAIAPHRKKFLNRVAAGLARGEGTKRTVNAPLRYRSNRSRKLFR